MEDIALPPAKRFKHVSYEKGLKDVRAPSALDVSRLHARFDEDDEEDRPQFSILLEHAHQVTLASPFATFARAVEPLSRSLPLLLLHHREIADAWLTAIRAALDARIDDGGLKTLLELLGTLARDIRTTLLPSYSLLLSALLDLLHEHIPVEALTQTLVTLGALWKWILLPISSGPSLDKSNASEEAVGQKRPRPVEDNKTIDPNPSEQFTTLALQTHVSLMRALCHTRCAQDIQRAGAEAWGKVLRRLKTGPRVECIQAIADTCARGVDIFFDTNISQLRQQAPQAGTGSSPTSEDMQNICAWIVVSSCTSVSQSLHSAAPGILEVLIEAYISLPSAPEIADVGDTPITSQGHSHAPEPERRVVDPCVLRAADERFFRLLRRVFTALIHHVKGPDEYVPVMAILSSRLRQTIPTAAGELDSRPRCSGDVVGRLLRLIGVSCAVRQGSRVNLDRLSDILHHLHILHYGDRSMGSGNSPPNASRIAAVHQNTVTLVASLLTSSNANLQLWITDGRKFLERMFSMAAVDSAPFTEEEAALEADTDHVWSLRLSGTLADLGWGGFKLVLLPMILRSTPKLLERDGCRTLRLLSTLHQGGKFDQKDVDIVWRQRISEWAKNWLQAFSLALEPLQETDVETLDGILSLLPMLSSASVLPPVVRIINSVLSRAEGAQEDYCRTPANSAYILYACWTAMATLDETTWKGLPGADASLWMQTVAESWSWSDSALEGIVTLVNSCSSHMKQVPLDKVYSPLAESILSHSRSLRMGALRLLTSKIISISDSARGLSEVLKRCTQGEEVLPDVQGVRERVLRIGRVVPAVPSDDTDAADACARWLLAQLKINLRPLWSPAAEALAQLAYRFDEQTWDLIFRQLQAADSAEVKHVTWDSHQEKSTTDDENDVREEERCWRDPSAHRVQVAVKKWHDDQAPLNDIAAIQRRRNRLDATAYEFQLLEALGHIPWLAEKYNRQIVPWFLTVACSDETSSPPPPRHRLSAWLTLLSRFTNPKALHSHTKLHALYMRLLAHPDRSLQRLALSCLLTYGSQHITAHQDKLRGILDDTRWRDELTMMDLNAIALQDRADFVDILIRLLYGLMLDRKGRGRGADRRAAALGVLGSCTDQELSLLVELMVQSIQPDRLKTTANASNVMAISGAVDEKQQLGFLTLLQDVLKRLGAHLVDRWHILLGTTIDITAHAEDQISGSSEEDPDIEGDDEDDEADAPATPSRTIRRVRQLGLKRFSEFFQLPVSYDFAPWVAAATQAFIYCRIPILDTENTQAPSSLLNLFYTWSLRAEYAAFLVQFCDDILPKVYDCIVATNVKPSVISRVFDIVEALLQLSITDQAISQTVFNAHVSRLLRNLAILVERHNTVAFITGPLGQRVIGILSEIIDHISDQSQATMLFSMFSPLFRRQSKLVSEKAKTNMLKVVNGVLPLLPDLPNGRSPLANELYEILSELFLSLRSRAARLMLLSTFERLSSFDTALAGLSAMLQSLNAYSPRRIDEPDFDRRLQAFATLNETMYLTLSSREWLPVLYNALAFIQDPEELAVRSNAALTMKRFLDAVALHPRSDYQAVFTRILYPGLKRCLRTRHDPVRAELVSVMAYSIKSCPEIKSLQEMKVLLADGDEEANFFNNIVHVQTHRRIRCLKRLAEHCREGLLSSTVLNDVFIPLVGGYVADTSTVDHHLVNEAIITIGSISNHLNWGPYHALIRHYLRLIRKKDGAERVYVRALVAILENFHFGMDEVVLVGSAEVDGENPDEMSDGNSASMAHSTLRRASAADSTARTVDAVTSQLLPDLVRYIEAREEADDNLRISMATGAVMVAKHLPEPHRNLHVRRLITVLCQILRSKSQDTRNLVKDALCRIAVTLGVDHLSMILQEMRLALTRGPQLHVLAFVTHAILVHVTTGSNADSFAVLDSCASDVAHVASEVIFGQSGLDLLSEDFKTKMREVRSSTTKGLASFGIISRYVTPSKIATLLGPTRGIMQHTEAAKVMRRVDDVLRQIGSGLNSNNNITISQLLVLCHTLINQNGRFFDDGLPQGRKPSRNLAAAQPKVDNVGHFRNNSSRFVTFGLGLFVTAYKRGRFNFEDPEVVSRLEPMVSVIGNALYSKNSDVLVLALRAAATIVQCPLRSISPTLPTIIKQAMEIVKQVGTTESEITQTALKSMATILRQCTVAQVKERDLAFLLELIKPDLGEPAKRPAVFAVLRAVISRKFVVPEIYDMMTQVAEIMVTDQSTQVQESCRGVLLQFLLDYPQGKGRLRNQMTFLAKNLSYTHESGRRSVLELLGAIISKFSAEVIQEYAELLFVSLVMNLVNEDSSKCREAAAELVKRLFVRLDGPQRTNISSRLHAWALQRRQLRLAAVAVQVYGLANDILRVDFLDFLQPSLEVLKVCLQFSAPADFEVSLDPETCWQLPYHCLVFLGKLMRDFASHLISVDVIEWHMIVQLLLFPHAWVRLAASRALGLYFAAIPLAAPETGESSSSLRSQRELEAVADKLCQQLKSEHLDDSLGLQTVKNLVYVGKCFCFMPMLAENLGSPAALDDSDGESTAPQHHPLPWLFSKLSYQARSAHIARLNRLARTDNWFQQPACILRWFAAMVTHMEADALERFTVHIMTPVYRLVNDETIHDGRMDELKQLAVELQDMLQAKVGTTKFTSVYNQIRQKVAGVRVERRKARAIQATVNPEFGMKRRTAQNLKKKASRQRSSAKHGSMSNRARRIRSG